MESDLGIPIAVEESEISSGLNSTILLVFLMGMYTIIYFGTIYVYFIKNPTRRIVPATITILFLNNVVQTGIQWYFTKWQFINNGDTRDSVFLAAFNFPPWVALVANISTFLGFVLADGLLIWRCYNVWNRSVRIISVPLLLVISETGLFLADIVIHGIFNHIVISPGLAERFNNLVAAAFFLSFATSLVTTLFIAYKIYSVSNLEGVTARRFKHTIDIVVQSGAVYSLSLFVNAIVWVVPGANDQTNTRVAAAQVYVQGLVIPVAGMSTTILVARVAMLAPNALTSAHLSGLQFHARSTHHTGAPDEIGTARSTNVDDHSVEERQEVKERFNRTKVKL